MATLDLESLATQLATADFKGIEPLLLQLEKFLTLRTYLGGYTLSPSDKLVWTSLFGNKVSLGLIRKASFPNVSRWYTYIETAHPEVKEELTAAAKAKSATAGKKQGANYNIGLKGTENGVVTRFPPEPSGYMHIGHAKAALLNDYFAHEAFDGKMILRFDDLTPFWTNPSRERDEYQQAITEDVQAMGIKIDRLTHTSDYFQELYELCEKLIESGQAYADDTDPEEQSRDRMARLASKRRDRPAAESLALFREMKAGSDASKGHCIRARIAYDSNNGALRDPVVYRFPNWKGEEPAPHHRTGWTWKIYPTYDFACPLVDSIEGVTHALRTTEYADRNEQYHWFLKALNMRPVHLWDFARINFIKTFLSKRKLTKVVDTGRVTGWDDPRLPTIRGIFRRGLTVPALRDFMLKQGPSRNVVNMDWTTIWANNKRMLDPIVPRHVAIEKKDVVTVKLAGGPEKPYSEEKPRHPKNPSLGTRTVQFGDKVIIDQADAASFKDNEEITLMGWGNAIVRKQNKADNIITDSEFDLHLEGDFKKTEKKVTWLAEGESKLVEAELWEFFDLLTKDSLEKDDNFEDFLNPTTAVMTEALCDANLAQLKDGEFLQLERKGYFRVDKAAGKGPGGKAVLFKIPTGSK